MLVFFYKNLYQNIACIVKCGGIIRLVSQSGWCSIRLLGSVRVLRERLPKLSPLFWRLVICNDTYLQYLICKLQCMYMYKHTSLICTCMRYRHESSYQCSVSALHVNLHLCGTSWIRVRMHDWTSSQFQLLGGCVSVMQAIGVSADRLNPFPRGCCSWFVDREDYMHDYFTAWACLKST